MKTLEQHKRSLFTALFLLISGFTFQGSSIYPEYFEERDNFPLFPDSPETFVTTDISILDTAKTTTGGVFYEDRSFEDSLWSEYNYNYWFGYDHLKKKLSIKDFKDFRIKLYRVAQERRISMSAISGVLWIESMYSTTVHNGLGYYGSFQVCRSTFNELRVKATFEEYKKMSLAEQLDIANVYWRQQSQAVNTSLWKAKLKKNRSRRLNNYPEIHFNDVLRLQLLQMYPRALKQRDVSNTAKVNWGWLARRRNGGGKTFGQVRKTVVDKNLRKLHPDFDKFWGL